MAIKMNNHVFKGHKTLFGVKYVTYREVSLPLYNEHYDKAKNFDWGFLGPAALQLSFAMLYEVTQNEKLAQEYAQAYLEEVVKYFGKDWIVSTKEIELWLQKRGAYDNFSQPANSITKNAVLKNKKSNRTHRRGSSKDNIVKRLCKEMGITQKELAKILEIPEGTVSSWAVKNEIPRLGKKAIEFYMQNQKQKEVIKSYKNFVDMLQKSA